MRRPCPTGEPRKGPGQRGADDPARRVYAEYTGADTDSIPTIGRRTVVCRTWNGRASGIRKGTGFAEMPG